MNIPRSIERGPVEAAPKAGSRMDGFTIPRSIERGPVEAPFTPRLRHLDEHIPRSIERGPVEALWQCLKLRSVNGHSALNRARPR